MTENQPTIVGHTDRVTGRPATIYTPPEDLVRNVPRADNQPDVSAPWDDDLAGPPVLELTRDRAAIRDSDEADEPSRTDAGIAYDSRPERVPVSGASVAALDLDAAVALISKVDGSHVRRELFALVAEVRRLTVESERRRKAGESLAEQGFDALDRAESAEAEVVTLRAQVAAVEAKRDEFADLLARALPAVAALARVEALGDNNPDHADTCGSMLTPGAGYPCSCWQADLRAALATTGEGQR